LRLQAASRPPGERAGYDEAIARYEKLAADQSQKKGELLQQAQQDQKKYELLNQRDDQFDLAETGITMAIAGLAIASLTRKWWLFGLALVPGIFGAFMGIAGLANWAIHPQWLADLLT
jgi:hypothetical protein